MTKDFSNPSHLSVAVGNTRLPVKFLESKVLEGCNIYCTSTVICQRIDLGSLTGIRSSAAGHDFASKFIERFVGLEKMTPTGHMNTDFLQRLNEAAGAPLAEVIFEAVLAVESSMALTMRNLAPIGFAEIFPTHTPAWQDLVWECASPKISREAARVACTGLLELLPSSFRLPQKKGTEKFFTGLARLKAVAQRRQRTTASEVLALSAKRRGLPCELIGAAYLQLGHGIAQHMIHDSFNGGNGGASPPAHSGSQQEEITHSALLMNELPLPEQWPAANIQEACQIADTFRYPVFLKPRKSNQAGRMSICIHTSEDMSEAFAQARRDGKGVLVEKFVAGQSHRLLVVDGRFVASLHIVPPSVTGDGIRTINELIDELNNDPIRNGVRQFRIEISGELVQYLKFSGYSLLDVPANGDEIKLHAVADILSGATHTDVTDIVHPDNKELAIKATAASNLQVAGIDFITTDITASHHDVGGYITSINPRPELYIHRWPRHGKSRDVGNEILKLAFPRGENGRIPIILVAGERGTARVARHLDKLMRESGKAVALSLPKASTICGEPLAQDTSRRRNSGSFLLRDPRAEMVISAMSPRSIVRHGLGLERSDVTAILDPVADDNIDTYCQGVEVLVKATAGTIIVNADNATALNLFKQADVKQLVLVSPSERDSIIQQHLNRGLIAVTGGRQQGQDHIVLRSKESTIASIPVAALVSIHGPGIDAPEIQVRMFALAMAYGAGLSGDELEAAVTVRAPLNLTA